MSEGTSETARYAFSARSYEWRLYSEAEAIEKQLKAEVERARAQHAFVVCSKSITGKTRTVGRIREALGSLFAGVFDGIEVDSTYRSVEQATAAAREAGADLLIAVGGGSVIVATRAVDVFLCEPSNPFEIMTQYSPGKPAYSPRLNAPKLPIINIVTTPTSAMNRAGTGLKNDDLDHRMEYFDPKTRPVSLFWDWEALLATPLEVIRSTATTTFSGALSGLGSHALNPLAEGDRDQIFRLARRAYERLVTHPEDVDVRIDLCAAALLSNRSADDAASGGISSGGRSISGNYAVSTALHVRYPSVGQGESTTVLAATVARRSAASATLDQVRPICEALGAWKDGMTGSDAQLAIADALEALYQRVGMPTRVRELNIPKEDLPRIARDTIKNFNANSGARSEDDQVRESLELLEAAW